jgi:hypothetical protein
MKVKFITCIYSNLYGSEFGGRAARYYHYRWSLISLLNMTQADFLCYTSDEEIDDLKTFFYTQHGIPKKRLKFKVFDLTKMKYYDTVKKYRDVGGHKHEERCYEIQYCKFFWMLNERWTYDYYFWIDAGLSHIGLIPEKYLIPGEDQQQQYYNSKIFDNVFLDKTIEKIEDKIFLIGKENVRNFWDHTVPSEFYKNYDNSLHIIGGMFGGKKDIVKKYCKLFNESFLLLIEKTNRLWYEENIMSLIYFNNKEMFKCFTFDTWWYEGSGMTGLEPDYFIKNKSFYKILEEIKDIN